MRSLHIIASLDPSKGGTSEAVHQFASVAASLNQEVTVLCFDELPPDWDYEGVRVHALGPALGTYTYSAKLIPWLKEKAHAFDCVIVHGLWQWMSFGTWLALRNGPTPYFVFPHGMLDPWFKQAYPMKHLKKWLYWPWSEYLALRDARAVLFTTEQEKLLARQSFSLYACNERVVTLGALGPNCSREAAAKALYDHCPKLQGQEFFVFLGRLHEKKACELLLSAFARQDADSQRMLLFAGPSDTEYGKRLKAQARQLGIADRVVFSGPLYDEAKWGALYEAEAFCLPSHQENFGIAVVEALACETPVLISNKVNIFDTIEAAGAGIIAEDNLAGVCEQLEAFECMDAAARAAMAQRAGSLFQTAFAVREAASRLVEVLRQEL